jgi:hypothetical protein
MPIPSHLVEAFRIFNEGRIKEGLKPFEWHDKLYHSAQELVDWGWDNYINGKADVSADPHHEFLERLDRAGWKYIDDNGLMPGPPPGRSGTTSASECGIGGTSVSRGEDGKDYPRDPSGWCHPFMAPESHAKELVQTLTVGITDPNEGHRWDYHAAWTHAALGYKAGMVVVDYGYLPGEPTPDPTPAPEPEKPLGPDDFDIVGS